MKYLPLVWAGLWRKRARTVLTLLCVVVAFALFGLLHGFTAALDGIVDAMSDTRLRIMSRVNITQPLPLAHRARIEAVPGVEGVSYYNFFAGYYQERSDSVSVGAIDVESFNVVYPDIQMDPQYVDAMLRTRYGALVGEDLAAERGWKIGDRIPLHEPARPRDGVLELLVAVGDKPVEVAVLIAPRDARLASSTRRRGLEPAVTPGHTTLSVVLDRLPTRSVAECADHVQRIGMIARSRQAHSRTSGEAAITPRDRRAPAAEGSCAPAHRARS